MFYRPSKQENISITISYFFHSFSFVVFIFSFSFLFRFLFCSLFNLFHYALYFPLSHSFRSLVYLLFILFSLSDSLLICSLRLSNFYSFSHYLLTSFPVSVFLFIFHTTSFFSAFRSFHFLFLTIPICKYEECWNPLDLTKRGFKKILICGHLVRLWEMNWTEFSACSYANT